MIHPQPSCTLRLFPSAVITIPGSTKVITTSEQLKFTEEVGYYQPGWNPDMPITGQFGGIPAVAQSSNAAWLKFNQQFGAGPNNPAYLGDGVSTIDNIYTPKVYKYLPYASGTSFVPKEYNNHYNRDQAWDVKGLLLNKIWGSHSCTDCILGKYQPAYEATECINCEYAYYNDEIGQPDCKFCDFLGTWSAKTLQDDTEIGTCEGSESCTLCTAGKYNNNLMNGCISCAGVLDSEVGKTACEICKNGRYLEMFDEGGYDAEGNEVPAPGQRPGQDLADRKSVV